MALIDILDAIRADADASVTEIEATCAAEVDELRRAADDDARRVEEEVAASRDLLAEREVSRIIDRARLDARRARLAAVETAYREVVEAVDTRLWTLRSTGAYAGVMGRLLDEALGVVPDAARAIAAQTDLDLVRGLLVDRGRTELAVVPGETGAGGLDLESDDGRAVRNTLASRLVRADGRLRRLIATRLPRGAW